VVHQAFYLGLESIVMPRFDLEKFCSIIQERRVTFANVVPPVVLLLGKSDIVSKYDLSSLRMLNSGAAPLTKELVHVVHRRLKLKIKQGYGLSETSPVTHEQVRSTSSAFIGALLKTRLTSPPAMA
jgi:acyl-coenzyme A synthetase/AMP-(fatty) acid ligase